MINDMTGRDDSLQHCVDTAPDRPWTTLQLIGDYCMVWIPDSRATTNSDNNTSLQNSNYSQRIAPSSRVEHEYEYEYDYTACVFLVGDSPRGSVIPRVFSATVAIINYVGYSSLGIRSILDVASYRIFGEEEAQTRVLFFHVQLESEIISTG